MNISAFKWAGLGFGIAGLVGCANVPKDAGFGEVQKVVATRTGHLVQWRGNTAADAAVDAAVFSALQQGLTADEAVQIALLNNLNLQATYQELGVAQANLVQAGLLKNPTLSFERRLPGQAAVLDVFADFLDLFFIPLRKRVAGAEFEAAKLRVADAVLMTAAQTRQAFYTLQGAEQMVEMRRSVAQATAASAEAAQRLREAGNITLLAFREEQKLAARAKLDLARAEAEVIEDRERLNVLMGLWGTSTDWKIASRLPALPATELSAQGLQSLAVSQRLDLGVAREEVEVAAQSLGLSRASRFVPNVNIGAHFEREADGVESVGPSIELPIPIFDQGQAVVARGGALLRQSQLRYAALAVEIRSEVRTAYSRMIAARDRVEYHQREVLPLAAQVVEQTQLQYNAMQTGVFQLLQAKQAQIEAGREYIETLREYWVARSELERAVGGRLRASESIRPATQPTGPMPTTDESHSQHYHGG